MRRTPPSIASTFCGIAEGTNSWGLCGALLGYYVHVHLYDGIFEGVSMLQPLKVGRRHRAVFLVASLVYVASSCGSPTPGTKVFAQQVGSFQDGHDEGEGDTGTTVHPISNPVGDAAMEGVKSKKEYMERNRQIFREKIATREVKDDLYDDLGRFWFEDDGRTWIMDLGVIYMLLRSTFGYMFCKIIPSCFHMKSAPADPDEDGHQRTGPDVEADTEAKNASRSRALSSRAEAGRSRLNKSRQLPCKGFCTILCYSVSPSTQVRRG